MRPDGAFWPLGGTQGQVVNFDMTKPCRKCPFRRGTVMKLTEARIRELDRSLIRHNGATFLCHETVDYSEDSAGRSTSKTKHCAGALAYIENQGVSSQMMRIAERLGMYDRKKLLEDAGDLVWEDVVEWLEGGALERRPKKKRGKK